MTGKGAVNVDVVSSHGLVASRYGEGLDLRYRTRGIRGTIPFGKKLKDLRPNCGIGTHNGSLLDNLADVIAVFCQQLIMNSEHRASS